MKLHKIFLVFLTMALIMVACGKDDEPVDTPIVKDETPYTLEYGNFPPPSLPADNALTEQGVLLGKMLFYDKKLSEGETQACADCHRQLDGFSDTLKFSLGVKELPGKQCQSSIWLGTPISSFGMGEPTYCEINHYFLSKMNWKWMKP
jgi:cytochrome c peroxidase